MTDRPLILRMRSICTNRRQALCFIDDQHFEVKLVARYDPVFYMPVKMIVNAGVHAVDVFAESFLQVAQRAKNGRRVKDGAGPLQRRVDRVFPTPAAP